MKVIIEYDIDDCQNCPFKLNHQGQGECWAECSHKDAYKKQGYYGTILYGCWEKFTGTPDWCPIFNK